MAGRAFLQVSVSDNAPILQVFRQLTPELQKASLQASIFSAASVIQSAVKAAAPRGHEPSRKTRTVRTTYLGKGRDRKKYRLAKPAAVAYDFGRLRENIIRKRGRGAANGEVAIGTGAAFWGLFLEKGTARMRPHPFFIRAVEGARSAFLLRLADELGKNVEAAALRLGGEVSKANRTRLR